MSFVITIGPSWKGQLNIPVRSKQADITSRSTSKSAGHCLPVSPHQSLEGPPLLTSCGRSSCAPSLRTTFNARSRYLYCDLSPKRPSSINRLSRSKTHGPRRSCTRSYFLTKHGQWVTRWGPSSSFVRWRRAPGWNPSSRTSLKLPKYLREVVIKRAVESLQVQDMT